VSSSPVPRRVIAERSAAGLVELAPHVLGACQAVERTVAMRGTWTAGAPGQRISLTELAIASYLRDVDRERRRGVAEVCAVIAATEHGPIEVIVDIEPGPRGSTAILWFPFPIALAADATSLVQRVAEGFGAYHAHLEDERLLIRYQARSAMERARAATPAHLRQYLPDTPTFADGVALPDLLVPQQYDRRRVPAGVWWINYWSAAQVAELGEERVRGAGWARVIDAADGAVVLVATDEPLDPASTAHLEHLRALLANLGIEDAQQRARYPA
jgi:hypothetical protein